MKIRALILAVCLVQAIGWTAVGQAKDLAYRWTNVKIGGGGFVSGLVFHPTAAEMLYARTDIGGAYRWMPDQQVWQPLLDGLAGDDQGRFGVESLALDPSDADRVYLAVGTYLGEHGSKGLILRSSDRGQRFARSELPFNLGGNEPGRGNGERLSVDPNNGRILLFGTRADGLWRSEDYGEHWREVEGFPAIAKSASASYQVWDRPTPIGIAFVVFDPLSARPGNTSQTIYAGVSTRELSLYRSTDAGASWTAVDGQPVGLRPNHMVRDSLGRWLVSYGDAPGPNTMNDGAVWRFDPQRGEWTDITPVPQSTDLQSDGFGWGAVAVDAQNPDIIVASTFNRFAPGDEVYRSTDGGQHWKPMLSGGRFDHSDAPWTANSHPHWIADLEIDPGNPQRLWFVTGYGAWVSRNALEFDAGTPVEWQFAQRGFEETVPLVLHSPVEGPHLISGVGDIDGFVHDALDSAPTAFAGVRYSNTHAISVAGQQPMWMVRSGYFHQRPEGAVRAAWSQDGGRHWSAFANEPPEGEGAGQITLAADAKRVIWRPHKAGHWITADFGGHWQAVKGLPATAVVEADRVDEGIYYGFDASSGKLYLSGNGGVAFDEVPVEVGAIGDWYRAEIHPHPERSGEAWITAAWNGLLHWSPGKLVRVSGVDNAVSLGVGKAAEPDGPPMLFVYGQVQGKTGLFRSDNGGRRWQRIDDDEHRFAGMVRHVTGDPRITGRIYFGTEGRGIWYGDPQ